MNAQPNKPRFRYYAGVRYVAAWQPAPISFARCGTCGRAWDDEKPTGLTPTPSGRCPFEYLRGHSTPKPTKGSQGYAPTIGRWGTRIDYRGSHCLTPSGALREIVRVYHVDDDTVGHVNSGPDGFRADVRSFNREVTETFPLIALRILPRF